MNHRQVVEWCQWEQLHQEGNCSHTLGESSQKKTATRAVKESTIQHNYLYVR